MMSYAPTPLADRKTLVIDASLAIRAILPLADQGQDILKQLAEWHREQVRLVAPEIWLRGSSFDHPAGYLRSYPLPGGGPSRCGGCLSLRR